MLFDPPKAGSYEFEDVILNVSNAQLLAPAPGGRFIRRFFGLAGQTGQVAASHLIRSRRRFSRTDVETADMLFVLCQGIRDVAILDAIPGWRRKFGKVVIWLEDHWIAKNHGARPWLKRIENVDLIICGVQTTVEVLQHAVPGRCIHLPPGIDALRFCPVSLDDKRPIEVCSIGRRSQGQHQALQNLAAQTGIYYDFDTLSGQQFTDHTEHRTALASRLQRSRFFIANYARAGQDEIVGNQRDIGFRHFEGIAAGAVLIGAPPDSISYRENLDWPDAVIETPLDGSSITDLVRALSADPDRISTARSRNIYAALTRHDWSYRWQAVMNEVNLPAPCTDAAIDRQDQLDRRTRSLEFN